MVTKFSWATRDEKSQRPQIILDGESDCKRCPLHETRKTVVLAEGSLDADIMFVGEAPGVQEDKTGHPMYGKAGTILDLYLQYARIDRSRVIVTNLIQCAPYVTSRLGKRSLGKPKKAHIEPCTDWLDYKIANSNVKVIVPLGSFALKHFLPKVTVGQGHGKAYEVTVAGKDVLVMPQYHPMVASRDPSRAPVMMEDYGRIAHAKDYLTDDPPNVKYEVIRSGNQLHELLSQLAKTRIFAFDFETTGLDYLSDSIVGIALAAEGMDKAYYVPTFDDHFSPKAVLNLLKPLFEADSPIVVAHNLAFETKFIWNTLGAGDHFDEQPVQFSNARDTMIEWHLLESEFVALKTLALRVLNIRMTDLNKFIHTSSKAQPAKNIAHTRNDLDEGKKFPTMLEASRAALDEIGMYACADADLTLELALISENWLREPDKAIPTIGHR